MISINRLHIRFAAVTTELISMQCFILEKRLPVGLVSYNRFYGLQHKLNFLENQLNNLQHVNNPVRLLG